MPADPLAPTHPRPNRLPWVLAGLAAIVVMVALFLLLDPFGDEELSRAEFLAQGDEICVEAHEAFTDLQDQTPATAREAVDLTEQLINIAEDERDEIDDLNGPSELDDEVDAYLSGRQEGIDLLHRGLDAAEDDDGQTYAASQAKVAAQQLERLELAEAVGFTECSRPLVDREELARQAEPPATSDPTAPPTVANPPGFPSPGEN
jgi:hypothetical protein